MLFQGNQFDDEVKDIMLYVTSASTDKKDNINIKNKDVVNTEDYLDDLTGGSQNNFSKVVDHDNNTQNINLTSLGIGTQEFKSLDIENTDCSEEQIACAYKRNKLV